ncbi:ATP-dependent zinc metalloprotease FtsH [Patescibacteria group bacterium]|nr:ATP-dependent zinc metalloprotease FtsH [Patescibacteria group bacterium]MBU1721327.1 ATP-dependent zinc metalloprotease FtsH [Patescibacteria group bacterium]MBU1901612.1 ATP-dependent zinc metalloprotease FtsH [Patescibacteria group bacterium]
MKSLLKNITIIVLVLFSVAAAASFVDMSQEGPEEIGVNRLAQEVKDGQVKMVEIEGDTLIITLHEEDKKQELKKEYGQPFTELMQNVGVSPESLGQVEVLVKKDPEWKLFLMGLAPFLLPFLLVAGLIYFMSRQVQGANSKAMSFGSSKAKEAKPDEKHTTKFKDVAGAQEAKEELKEIVSFLKHPKKFADMGAKIPRGALLMGAPGTGKTLLAKAVAGEAEVPFYHMSGSEFVEMFVGVGASRVRDLFNKAKKSAPAIVFIDEIDAVGRKRGAGLGGGHDEREQTLNQILVEMDGFAPNSGVIVMAATNRPDVLDKALLRPGRFDRRIVIDMPDINDREEILKVHAKNKPFAKDVDLRIIAERTPGFTGADLESLLNEAAILAVKKNKKEIREDFVRQSIDKVLLGPEKRSRVLSDKEKEMTAYHEAGHAIVGHFLRHCDPVRKVSIIGRGMAGGYTLSMPATDKRYQTIAQFRDDLAMTMGGYVIEKMQYGDDQLSTGPSSDLKKATQIATKMVMQYGMTSDLGPRVYGDNEELIFLAQEIHEKKNYSEKTAEQIDMAINEILAQAEKTAKETLIKYKKETEALVKALIKDETIEQEEFINIVGKRNEK